MVGVAITSANNGYYPGEPIYRAPTVYIEDDKVISHVDRRRYVDAYGDMVVRRIRFCE